ncbi:MAG: TonB-dependent receptor [Bacteroidota bacterium]|nr:TonB-dependent receptor [Bacteroidota bacterium]
MKKIIIILLWFAAALNIQAEVTADSQTNLQGKITDKNGEPVIGASLYFPDLKTGTVTNTDGFYKIGNLPKRKTVVQINSVGYKMILDKIDLGNTHQKNYVLDESVTEINEVTVTGQAAATQMTKMPSPITVVTTTQLQQQASTNIIDALSSQPGFSQITTGSGISKPVIRGLGYNRVVVLNNGVRQEGQQWGDEHGIEIDENEVNRVEILKGPASLMYGSDAMAGVINFFSAPILPQGQMKVNALANYQTNNGLMAYSLDFAGHKNVFVWDVRYSQKQAHAYQNRMDGSVYNSGFSENAASALVGVSNWWGYSHLTVSRYHLTPGIIEGERDSLTGKFLKPVILSNGTAGETLATNADFTTYHHQMPYQQVNHYKAVWDNSIMIGEGSLKATVGYQQNRRQEFDDVLNPSQYGLYFQLHTITYDLNYRLPEMNGYNISFGVNGMGQNSLNKGTEFLVPEYRLFDIGAFIVGKKTFGKVDVSGGLRMDNRAETGDALYLNTAGAKTTSNAPTATERFTAFSSNFNGISGSLGASLQLTENWITKLNLSRGFRAPNIDELSSNGVHEGTIRYEIGNPQLKPESSLQLDYELGYNTEHVSAKLNLFANNISNYIFSHKLNSLTGGDSIQSGYPAFKFDAGKVQMLGGEVSIDIHPHPLDWLHFENSFSYVYSHLLNQPDSTRYLPFTPAPKWISGLRAELNNKGKLFRNTHISFGLEHDFKQGNIYSAYNTETVTEAYTLLNAGIGTDIVWNKHKLFSVLVDGTNLGDIAYQSHLSRLKYAPVNNATGKTGVFNMGRNISFKVIVPVDL